MTEHPPPRSWGAPMVDRFPRTIAITGVQDETPLTRTIFFDHAFHFTPGQFVMVWVPGVDEIPMALSSASSITVQRVGDATAALTSLGRGDLLGMRGPFGNGFPDTGRALAVAGGAGAAPLLPLAGRGGVEMFLLGARSAPELLFRHVLEGYTRLAVATDDGSEGYHGLITDLLEKLVPGDFDRVCVCGPERMMEGVLSWLTASGCPEKGFFSLHRYMKCGMGVCGSCCLDPEGLRVCHEGPVFRGDQLIGSEFGRYSRDGSGRRFRL